MVLTSESQEGRLTDKQLVTLQAAAESQFHGSLTEIAKRAGVARETLSRWLANDATFSAQWRRNVNAMFQAAAPGVANVVIKQALKGDRWACEHVLQAAGQSDIPQVPPQHVSNTQINVMQARNWEEYQKMQEAVAKVIDAE